MKNWYWIAIGALVGFGCGALFGLDYAIAGIGIGIAGGIALAIGMRRT